MYVCYEKDGSDATRVVVDPTSVTVDIIDSAAHRAEEDEGVEQERRDNTHNEESDAMDGGAPGKRTTDRKLTFLGLSHFGFAGEAEHKVNHTVRSSHRSMSAQEGDQPGDMDDWHHEGERRVYGTRRIAD